MRIVSWLSIRHADTSICVRLGGLCLLLLLLVGPATAQDADISVEQLAERLQSVELDERRDAAYELARRGPAALPALKALIVGLSDRDEQVWMQSTMAIARIGGEASEAIEPLIDNFDQRAEQRRYRAAWAASRIGESAVPALISATRDESALVRAAALDAMGWMDEASDEIVPCLASSLQDEQTEVQIQAAKSLVKRLPESVEPTVAALGHKEGRVREIAAKGLAQLDAIPVTAQPLLLELTQDQDPAVRAAAVLAIGNTPIT
ncbi:MAG: HEAT repeat domain-containing protein, partial [Rubripirellula sp.]